MPRSAACAASTRFAAATRAALALERAFDRATSTWKECQCVRERQGGGGAPERENFGVRGF